VLHRVVWRDRVSGRVVMYAQGYDREHDVLDYPTAHAVIGNKISVSVGLDRLTERQRLNTQT
jgi:hypothetical protein